MCGVLLICWPAGSAGNWRLWPGTAAGRDHHRCFRWPDGPRGGVQLRGPPRHGSVFPRSGGTPRHSPRRQETGKEPAVSVSFERRLAWAATPEKPPLAGASLGNDVELAVPHGDPGAVAAERRAAGITVTDWVIRDRKS